MRAGFPEGFRLRLALAILLLVAVTRVMAQNGSVRADLDARRIGVDDVVTLSIFLDGEAAGLEAALPSLKNLRVVGGPSTSTQISFVNGSMSRQKILTFVLRADKPGTAEVGAIMVQGYPPTATLSVEVVQGAIRPAQPQDPFGRDPFGGRDPFEEIFGRPQRRQPVSQGKLFVEATLSRPSARVGEPILVTYFVYTQISLSGVEFAEAPKYPGFWAEELDRTRGDSSGENTSVQGEPFLRYSVLERLLFPTRAGPLEIPEARLRLVPAGGTFGIAAPIERTTKALRVNVESLPKGTPEGTAVGSYDVQATTDRTSLAMGDAVTYRFKVKGRGNVKWIDAPPRLEIADARVFPPRAISDFKTTRKGIEGSKTWEFVIVPEKVGVFEIPSIPFSSFDPHTQSIKTVRTTTISLAVLASTAVSPLDSPKNASTAVALRADLDTPPGDLFPLLSTLALVSLAVQFHAWRRRPSATYGTSRNESAVREALLELKGGSLLGGTKERSAARISGALESVFGQRAGWPSNDVGDRLRSLADDLEFLRFAPQLGSYDEKLVEVRDRAIALVETAQ